MSADDAGAPFSRDTGTCHISQAVKKGARKEGRVGGVSTF